MYVCMCVLGEGIHLSNSNLFLQSFVRKILRIHDTKFLSCKKESGGVKLPGVTVLSLACRPKLSFSGRVDLSMIQSSQNHD